MDNIILSVIAIAIFFVPELFLLKNALKSMKAGLPYKEWNDLLGKYENKISHKVKFWETDDGKLYLWGRFVCALVGGAIILWVLGVFA